MDLKFELISELHKFPNGVDEIALINTMIELGWNPLDIKAILQNLENECMIHKPHGFKGHISLSPLGISCYFEMKRQFEVDLKNKQQNLAQFIVQCVIAVTSGLTLLATVLIAILQ